jgi:ribosomal protein L4
MATIDVYNLSGAKAGTLELADEVFGAVNEDLLWEAITHYRACGAGGHACHQEPLAGFRIGQEAVEAEGHGAGAYRLDPFAAVAPRRHGARTAAALL